MNEATRQGGTSASRRLGWRGQRVRRSVTTSPQSTSHRQATVIETAVLGSCCGFYGSPSYCVPFTRHAKLVSTTQTSDALSRTDSSLVVVYRTHPSSTLYRTPSFNSLPHTFLQLSPRLWPAVCCTHFSPHATHAPSPPEHQPHPASCSSCCPFSTLMVECPTFKIQPMS